jgi:peptidoglycan-N-acetylglucosamine deacetylase
MSQFPQIFQTDSTVRYRSFKWTARVILLIALFFFVIVVIAFRMDKNPSALNYQNQVNNYHSNLVLPGTDPDKPGKRIKYKGIRDFLHHKVKEDSIRNSRQVPNHTTDQFIRAAFYTPWNTNTSTPSLENYGDKINVIFPEWFFIDTTDNNKIETRIDSRGLRKMQQQGLKIMPMLTNFNSAKKDFDGRLIHAILNDTNRQQVFIKAITDTLAYYHFQGINIDFEEITEPNNEPLTRFQQNLYTALHLKGFTVTQDITAGNSDYDFNKLIDYNDYIILMAYDQNNGATKPGPIAAQKWIEQSVDEAAKKMASNKIILGVAGYGYDWKINAPEDDDEKVKDITYSEAIDNARLSGATIDFDDNTYNLHYAYEERSNNSDDTTPIHHEVWFIDAATTFNIMRFADEYGLAGTALWRLGGEDPRIWDFYNLPLDNEAVSKDPFNYDLLETVPVNPNQKPTSVGEGELLNILYTPQQGTIKLEIDSAEQLITEQIYTELPSGYVYQKFGEDTSRIGPGHKIILTFDDGPSSAYTPKILDILKKEKVPATFFVVGLQGEENLEILKRVFNEGHEIGNHTFTHHNLARMGKERAEMELKTTRLLIEAITGRSTTLFRAPYNADSEPSTFEEIEPLVLSKQDNYITVGESIDPNDWDPASTADTIVARTIRQAEEGNASIILLHDAGGVTRQPTLDALPRIIHYFKDKGCRFTTVADLMGKTRDDVMPLIKRDWKMKFSAFFARFTSWLSHFIFSLFVVGIFLSVGRMIFMAFLAWFQRKKENRSVLPPLLTTHELVSVIIPAYNEEVNAVRTVNSLLQQDYPNLELVFVDDGSRDNTFRVVKEQFAGHPAIQVLTKINGGKASALNFGIAHAKGKYVVCIDADTQLRSDAVTELMKKFQGPAVYRKGKAVKVAAVAGNVKAGNEVNMITRWQSIEYITSQNFDRRAFDYLNCITVVPGAIGAFEKDAILEAGGFMTDTLAEDCDLTIRLHRLGYLVRNCNEAISYTEVPETMRQFLKQRFRWSFGVMQCFWKHRDTVFNPSYRNFGMIAMPHILVFQMLLPFLAPLADLFLVGSLIAAGLNIIPVSTAHIILYYAIFSVVDMAGAALAFAFEKEDYKKLWWMIPQRFIYRQLMYYILFKSFKKAIKGEWQGWGILKRTGNVKPVNG